MSADRPLRYSERKRLAETGTLGDLRHDQVPVPLINATLYFFKRASAKHSSVGSAFESGVRDAAVVNWGHDIGEGPNLVGFLMKPEPYLDFVEILVEQGAVRRRVFRLGSKRESPRPAWSDAERDLNNLFERHRFGYRLEAGHARRIGSPALDEVIIGPALLAVPQPGWEEVERSFREALSHQRGPAEENDDALTAAHAALEAALKAAGLRGDRLSALAKSLRGSGLVPSQLEGVPDLLDDLLKRSSSIRDSLGDAHGKAPGAPEVPQPLVDLAIHWTASFIVYLAEATR
jgi:hypothetical protein